MPLYRVLTVLIILDGLLLAFTATLGIALDGRETMMRHFTFALLTSSFTCFIHVLCLFYLIGTGKDVRDAVEEHEDLRAKFVPWTRSQKRRLFPPACFAVTLIIVATLMGGEVHSRVLSVDSGKTLPFREVTGWWVHLLFVILALGVSAWAFWAEIVTVKENRRGIEELNRELAAREAPTPSAPEE